MLPFIPALISTVVGGLVQSGAQRRAASEAANAQREASNLSIAEQRRQFDRIQELFAPYVQAGTDSLSSLAVLSGARGEQALQQRAQEISEGDAFQFLLGEGENAILQSAAATGGLRGGDTQRALATLAPGLLSQELNRRFADSLQMASLGRGAAGTIAQGGQNFANAFGAEQQRIGAARQGEALSRGQTTANLADLFTNTIGRIAADSQDNQFGKGVLF